MTNERKEVGMKYSFRIVYFYERSNGGISEPEETVHHDVPEERALLVLSKEQLAEMLEKGSVHESRGKVHFVYELIGEAQ